MLIERTNEEQSEREERERQSRRNRNYVRRDCGMCWTRSGCRIVMN